MMIILFQIKKIMRQIHVQYLRTEAVSLQASRVKAKTNKVLKLILVLFLINVITAPVYSGTGRQTGRLPHPFLVIPQPKQIEILKGKGLEAGQLEHLKIIGNFDRPIMGSILSQLTESELHGQGILTLRLDDSESIPASDEGYVLNIANGNAEVLSGGEAGLFYGCQTLEQVLEDARDFNVPVPACKITDFPSLPYRAIHIDVKHHLDHMHYYYSTIDRLARYKINAIIFEFEDKLRYQKQPLVGAPHAIGIDEMAALTRYARDRHIEISPLVQGLGHATYILKHPQYADLRELSYNRWAFCPMEKGTYRVLFDLYSDAIKATPGARYLHVGGDEIGNIGLCPRCKPTADKKGMISLNLYWLNRVCEFAEKAGRIPIVWDDMPLKEVGVYGSTRDESLDSSGVENLWESATYELKQLISQFPKNCIYMRWNYTLSRQLGNIKALNWYKNNGLKAMVATAAQSGPAVLFPFDDRGDDMSSRGIPAIKSFIELAAQVETEGMLCTAWDNRSLHFETYWRGFIASAAYSWSPYSYSLETFDIAWMQREFAFSISDYVKLYKKLRDAAIFWEKAFNRQGSREHSDNALIPLPGLHHQQAPKKPDKVEKIDFSSILIELPDLQKPGKWSHKYAERLTKADSILKEYQYNSNVLNELYNHSKRNRYHWEVFIALNNFQVTAPRLLLALKKCDAGGNDASQQSGFDEVKAALQEFDQAWEELQEVYSKTRFNAYSENYVPDRYYHYASQREDLTWMIQVEEIFHQSVKEFLEFNN